MSPFNYGFKISLNTTLTTFYSNYNAFLLSLASQVQSQNIQAVSITSITSGSVYVSGNLTTTATSQSNDATSQYNNLQSLFSQSSIAGMPILNSNIYVNNGSINQSSSGPNLALILGICIPIGIIGTFIFMFSYWIIGLLFGHSKE